MKNVFFLFVSFLLIFEATAVLAQKKGNATSQKTQSEKITKGSPDNNSLQKNKEVDQAIKAVTDTDSLEYNDLLKKMDSIKGATKSTAFQAIDAAVVDNVAPIQSEQGQSDLSPCDMVLSKNETKISTYESQFKKRVVSIQSDTKSSQEMKQARIELNRKILELKIAVNIGQFVCDCYIEKNKF
ncbi:MAG: hypothetical protein ACKO5C_09265 [Ferruginibacter sp.]